MKSKRIIIAFFFSAIFRNVLKMGLKPYTRATRVYTREIGGGTCRCIKNVCNTYAIIPVRARARVKHRMGKDDPRIGRVDRTVCIITERRFSIG